MAIKSEKFNYNIFHFITHYYSIDSKNDFFFSAITLVSYFFLSVIVFPEGANLKLSEYITFWVREFKVVRNKKTEQFFIA